MAGKKPAFHKHSLGLALGMAAHPLTLWVWRLAVHHNGHGCVCLLLKPAVADGRLGAVGELQGGGG